MKAAAGFDLECDYLVIGAGTAGCALANRLSEDPTKHVVLLEAGGRDNYHWIHIPIGYLYCIGNPRTDWGYKTAQEPGLNGRSLGYPRGRVLGGCSSINGMLYLRGQAADYDGWRQMGNTGWGWDDVLPFFKKSEDYYDGADAAHGEGGEWRVDKQRLSWDLLDAYKAACVAAGIPESDDFNRGDNFGVGYFKVNQKAGFRWNTAKAFLRPAKSRKNLQVITQAQVARLVLDGKRAVGAELLRDSGVRRIKARAEVVLSAGAIGSPQIMQLSGIGPAGLLSENGIDVVHDQPGVGDNLQDHLQLRCAYKVEGVKTLNMMSSTLWGKGMIGLEYVLKRSGPLSMAPSQLGVFARSDTHLATPDLEFHVQPLSLEAFGQPLHPFPAFTASVCNLRPESRGSVCISDADPRSHPVIKPNYLSTEGDRQVAVKAIRLAREIARQAPLKKFNPVEFKPGPAYETDAELARAAGDVGTTIFHPVGTVRMGSDPASVVDPQLKVRGIEGLRVADASVMPTITSGNTNSPTLMIAEKCAAMMRAAG